VRSNFIAVGTPPGKSPFPQKVGENVKSPDPENSEAKPSVDVVNAEGAEPEEKVQAITTLDVSPVAAIPKEVVTLPAQEPAKEPAKASTEEVALPKVQINGKSQVAPNEPNTEVPKPTGKIERIAPKETHLSPPPSQSVTPSKKGDTVLKPSPVFKKTIPTTPTTPTTKVVPASKKMVHASPLTSPKTSPQVAAIMPSQKKTVGPLSPTKSISSRRSSSPFLPSPTGPFKFTPQKTTQTATKSTPKAGPSSVQKSTPKIVKPTPTTTPRTLTSSTSKAGKNVSPAPPKASPSISATKTTTARPRSALDHATTPVSRRLASQTPIRPSTSASKHSPGSLNRSISLRNLPKVKSTATDSPPVPRIPRTSQSPSQDYSHLPAFMRPTAASSAKVVTRPTSSSSAGGENRNKRVI